MVETQLQGKLTLATQQCAMLLDIASAVCSAFHCTYYDATQLLTNVQFRFNNRQWPSNAI